MSLSLKNGAATYAAMLAAIRGATDNINMEMYIFSDGPVGRMFADALIERQRHGVQVNLSYDALGSFSTSAAFFDRMRNSGIAVMEYRPVDPFAARLQWELGHRDHRKMLVVDGRVAFTGGINISEVYSSGPAAAVHKHRWLIGAIPISKCTVRQLPNSRSYSFSSGTIKRARYSKCVITFPHCNVRATR